MYERAKGKLKEQRKIRKGVCKFVSKTIVLRKGKIR